MLHPTPGDRGETKKSIFPHYKNGGSTNEKENEENPGSCSGDLFDDVSTAGKGNGPTTND